MSPPKYQAIPKDQIKKYELPGAMGTVDVIAGEYKGIKGAASTFTPVCLFNLRLPMEAKAEFEFPSHYNTSLLVIEGAVRVNESEPVPTDHYVVFLNDGETFTVKSEEPSVVLILSGEPINEPVAAHGPFVMNTDEEIRQAYDDFNQGGFGYLED
jgi:redox-sensitive bicupin YhaK (pirin superfamily)